MRGSRAFCPATLGNLRTRKTESRGLPFLYSLDMSRRWGATWLVLAIGVVLACGRSSEDDNQFREDVFECEEARARLDNCCGPGVANAVVCEYYDFRGSDGCGNLSASHKDPALTVEDSECVRATTCESLVAQGVCTRAMGLSPQAGTSADGGKTSRARICP